MRTAYCVLTTRCNLRCKHCYYNDYFQRTNEELGLRDWQHIIRGLKKTKCIELSLTGGEPALRKDLEEIVSYGRRLGFVMTICTNGSLLTRSRLKSLHKNGLNNIYISLDSLDANSHNQYRQKFAETFKTLQNSLGIGFDTVGINTTLTNSNVESIDGMVEYCRANDVALNISPAWKISVGNDDAAWISKRNLNRYFNATKKWKVKYGLSQYYEQAKFISNARAGRIPQRCVVCQNDVVVSSSGDVLPCFYNTYKLGSAVSDEFNTIMRVRKEFVRTHSTKKCCKNFCWLLMTE